MKITNTKKKGISLIVLVITIIVMIILAATVMISLSNNGIINKAKDAVNANDLKEIQHIATLAWSEAYIENMSESDEAKKLENLKTAVDKVLENIDTSGYDIKVDGKGVTVSYLIPSGLYDDNGSLVASWEELINTYGVDFEVKRHYPGSASSTALRTIIDNNSKLQSATILRLPGDWTEIPKFVFEDCDTLKSIIIPETVVKIDDYAFYNCDKLENLIIPSGVNYVGDLSFSGCTALEYNEYDNAIYLGNQNNPYHILVSSKNSEITSCEVNGNTKIIMCGAFSGCASLTSLSIPNGVIMIGRYAFSSCTSLTTVNIPDSVKIIKDSVFEDCTSLINVNIPNGITNIESYLFKGCTSLTRVDIPEGITVIEIHVFENCTSLTSVDMPDSITSIGISAFENCTSLTSIDMPDSITSIVDYTFRNCTSLISVDIPDSMTSIGHAAFAYCSSLTTIRFKGTVEEWKNIEIANYWMDNVRVVICSDGTLSL